MHRFLANRVAVVAGALGIAIVAAATAVAVTFASSRATRAVFVNGGARQWIAFDPEGFSIGSVPFLHQSVEIVNTANAPNPFVITYEPQHVTICAATLTPGSMNECHVPQGQHYSGGYFQVVATQNVLMGGRSDVPVLEYKFSNGHFDSSSSSGPVQNIPLVWQQGCPPRAGSGCPLTATPTTGGPGVG